MKKRICSLLAGIFLLGALAACGGDAASPTAGAGSGTTPTANQGEPQKVVFWHNNNEDEAKVYEKAAEAYNEAQDKYYVETLSVTDEQKLVVALSSNEAPDVVKMSNSVGIQYMLKGLLENMQPMIDAEGYDLTQYASQAIDANKSADGDVYGLPIAAYTIQLYYNVDMLHDLGYDEPPTTMEEMYKIAVEGTVLNEDGTFDVLGYPLLPFPAARQELIYAFGGHWWDPQDLTTMTPEAPGNLASLEMNVQYRELYDQRAIAEAISNSNSTRYTAQDPFFLGKQLFRIDGSWLPTMMAEKESDVNWAITLIPGTEANPELRGVSRYETSVVVIPKGAPNKEGAWDFAKWMGEEGARIIDIGTGNLPALTALYEDEEILALPAFPEFIEALKLEKGIQYPLLNDFKEYMDIVQAHLEEIYAGDMTPEEGLAAIAKNTSHLS